MVKKQRARSFVVWREKKRNFVRISLLVEIFYLYVWFFWNKKYTFSYTSDLWGRVGDKTCFTRSISGNKTTFSWPYLSINKALLKKTTDDKSVVLETKFFYFLAIEKSWWKKKWIVWCFSGVYDGADVYELVGNF